MAVSSVIGALRVNLGLDSAQFTTGLNKSQAKATAFQKNMTGIATRLTAAFGAILGVRAVATAADTWSDLSARVGNAVGSMDAAPDVMGRIADMARDSYSDLSQTAEAFIANNQALKDLGFSTAQQLDYTEALNNALVVSGARGERAASVNKALSDAMATGKLSGDGLNSILSNGGRVAKALADELGTTVSGLRKMGTDGKITANLISRALLGSMEALRREASDMPATIGDGMTQLRNSFIILVGIMDGVSGASSGVATVLLAIADGMRSLAQIIVDNGASILAVLQQIAVTVAIAAAAFATKYAVAVGVTFVQATMSAVTASIALEMRLGATSRSAAIAGAATKLFSRSLIVLRGAIISTGIGALVVGAGYLVSKFLDLVKASGGFGNAMSLMGDVAAEVWQRIQDGGWATVLKIQSYAMTAQAYWQKAWAAITGGVADTGELEFRAGNLSDQADILLDGLTTPLASMQALRDVMAETETQANSTSLATEGIATAAGEAGEKGKKKLTDLQQVMKDLREELTRLKATWGMSDLDTKIWDTQREAGVKANSAAGQQIAMQVRQIENLKELKSATEEWRDSVSSALSDFIMKGGSFRDVLGTIITKLAEIVANNAFNSLFQSVGGTDLIGGILKGFGIGANANGTNNWEGGWSRVHERGGEIMNLPKGTQVIPHDISKRMADSANSGGGGVVEINVNGATGNSEIQQMVSTGVAQGLKAYDGAMPQRLQQINRQPRFR